ncbi:unnamed protein product [marine sediment metagenome]|uniref:HTH-like domain-containing protein n=1 Tax=marine sediment metagenome TaxID=412755 RepID=X0Z5G6_9ZZZZ
MTEVSRSGYYYKPKGDKSKDAILLERIREVATEFPSYGYRRVTAQLRRQGIMVNRKRVYRIMHEISTV